MADAAASDGGTRAAGSAAEGAGADRAGDRPAGGLFVPVRGAGGAAGPAAAGPPRWLGARAGAADTGGPGGDTIGLHAGESFTAIAARLGKAVSTVSREAAANGGRAGYRAWRAHQRAREQARRPKPPKLACPQLAAQVTAWLAQWWSPARISARLRIEFPGDPMMQVSHETIYQALYVQGRGELRRELARCLRAGQGQAPPPPPRREDRADQGHGDDQRTARRG